MKRNLIFGIVGLGLFVIGVLFGGLGMRVWDNVFARNNNRPMMTANIGRGGMMSQQQGMMSRFRNKSNENNFGMGRQRFEQRQEQSSNFSCPNMTNNSTSEYQDGLNFQRQQRPENFSTEEGSLPPTSNSPAQ